MAKTLWSFGHSECNRVKVMGTPPYSSAIYIHKRTTSVTSSCFPRKGNLSRKGLLLTHLHSECRVLAILSAIGLKRILSFKSRSQLIRGGKNKKPVLLPLKVYPSTSTDMVNWEFLEVLMQIRVEGKIH